MILLGDKLGESSKTDPDANDDDTEDSEDDKRAVADAENLKCDFVFLNANILAGKSSLRHPKLKQTKKVSRNTFFFAKNSIFLDHAGSFLGSSLTCTLPPSTVCFALDLSLLSYQQRYFLKCGSSVRCLKNKSPTCKDVGLIDFDIIERERNR